MAWDSADGYVLLFGGLGCTGSCHPADTWTFQNGVWTNITAAVTGTPPGVYYARTRFGPVERSGGHVFGGESSSAVLDYTWAYRANLWTNLSSTVAAPHTGFSCPPWSPIPPTERS